MNMKNNILFKTKLEELRNKFQIRKRNIPKLINPNLNPIYDDVYFEGVEWLNQLSYTDDIMFKIEQQNKVLANSKKFMYQEIDRIKTSYSENGWDGVDAQAVSQAAINDAKTFIENLPDDVLAPTAVRLAADGEINFLWKLSNFKLDLGMYGDNTYSYFGKTTFSEKFYGDDKLISENLPEDVLSFISYKY